MYSSFVDKLEICRVVVKKTLKISILIHWHSLMEVHVEGGGGGRREGLLQKYILHKEEITVTQIR